MSDIKQQIGIKGIGFEYINISGWETISICIVILVLMSGFIIWNERNW
jgi:hypothetical protein